MRMLNHLFIAVPALLLASGGLTVRELSFHGTLHAATQQLDATIATAVHTPFGALPIGGQVRATYACDGTVRGIVSYGVIVRFLARLRGLTLVSAAEASIGVRRDWNCRNAPDSVTARFAVNDTIVTGTVKFGGQTGQLTGVVNEAPRNFYRLVLITSRDGRPDTTRVILR
jgi:hypothetical protein